MSSPGRLPMGLFPENLLWVIFSEKQHLEGGFNFPVSAGINVGQYQIGYQAGTLMVDKILGTGQLRPDSN